MQSEIVSLQAHKNISEYSSYKAVDLDHDKTFYLDKF